MSYSLWWLFFDRLISGVGGCLRVIMMSELGRSSPEGQLLSALSMKGMTFAFGFVISPAICFQFLK